LRQARPIMVELVRQARETAYVAVLRRDGVVPVEAVEADRSVRIVSQVGETLPLHCTAAGKALLAFQAEEDLRSVLPDTLPKFTERTPADRQTLHQQLKSLRTNRSPIALGH